MKGKECRLSLTDRTVDFEMKTRIITGIVALVVFLPFLIFSGTPALVVFTVFATAISVYEMCGCMRQRKKLYIFIPAEIYAVSCAVSVRLCRNFFATFVLATALFAFYVIGVAMFSKGTYGYDEALAIIFGIAYVVFGYCSIVLVRDLEHGVFLFWLIFIAAWLSDTGAYFVGVLFGKHKLIPDISPKKTVEGLIGGVVCCMLMFLIYGDIVTLFDEGRVANVFALLIAGALLSLISVFGDLLASFIKRRYKIKDYGWILPGHGGLLDRFDSVLAVSIALYAFCYFLSFLPMFSAVA